MASFFSARSTPFRSTSAKQDQAARSHRRIFVQDDWKLTRRLTVNLGARYSSFPIHRKEGPGRGLRSVHEQLDYLGKNGYPRSARELHYGNVAPRIGFAFMASPEIPLCVRASASSSSISRASPLRSPLRSFRSSRTCSSRPRTTSVRHSRCRRGPSVAPIPLTPDAGLGQSVYTADRKAGAGIQSTVEPRHAARRSQRICPVEFAYVGSHIVHVGIPDSNLNQLTAAELSEGAPLLQTVPNPYYGQIPASSSTWR